MTGGLPDKPRMSACSGVRPMIIGSALTMIWPKSIWTGGTAIWKVIGSRFGCGAAPSTAPPPTEVRGFCGAATSTDHCPNRGHRICACSTVPRYGSQDIRAAPTPAASLMCEHAAAQAISPRSLPRCKPAANIPPPSTPALTAAGRGGLVPRDRAGGVIAVLLGCTPTHP